MTRKAELDEQAVVNAYRAGRTIRELADQHGVSLGPIQRVLREHGVKARKGRGADKAPRRPRATAKGPRAFTDQQRAEVVARFLAGESQAALADAFRCGATTIQRVLRAGGVPAGAHGQMRDRHHNWKGGRRQHRDGYVMVRPENDDTIGQAMKGVNGYVLEHRLVMAHALGRPLTASETVHHKDDVRRDDNRLENLQLRQGRHGKGAAFRCRACGSHDVEAVDLD